jgi:hypothetical protein
MLGVEGAALEALVLLPRGGEVRVGDGRVLAQGPQGPRGGKGLNMGIREGCGNPLRLAQLPRPERRP